MKWRFVYPWHRRVTPSSSILILRLLSIGVFFPLSPPSSPRTFPQLPLPFHSSVSFSLSVAPLLPNVRSLSSRSSPSLHFSLSLSLLTLTTALSASRRNSLSRKKGKKTRKIDAQRRLAALGCVHVRIRPRRVPGRGLKMSSRCVIAYIDPTLFGVYVASTDITPTRRT